MQNDRLSPICATSYHKKKKRKKVYTKDLWGRFKKIPENAVDTLQSVSSPDKRLAQKIGPKTSTLWGVVLSFVFVSTGIRCCRYKRRYHLSPNHDWGLANIWGRGLCCLPPPWYHPVFSGPT